MAIVDFMKISPLAEVKEFRRLHSIHEREYFQQAISKLWYGRSPECIKTPTGKPGMNPVESDGGGMLFTKLRLKIAEHPVVKRQEIKG